MVPGYDRIHHQPWGPCGPRAHQCWALSGPHVHQLWALCDPCLTGDLLLAVDGELVNDPEAAIEILARAPRALNLVVWRSRPDPVPHDNYAPSAIGTGTSTGIPASSAGGESGVVGAVPWAYYAHSVLQGGIAEGGGCEAPPNVPLFEDLTVGDRI